MLSAQHTIKYLKENGLESIKVDPWNISVREYDHLMTLNYDIFSPKSGDLPHECRNLILNKHDFSVISQSFKRFFNLGEFDVNDFEFDWAEEKADGSIISLYIDPSGNLQYSTRSSAFAEVLVNDTCTFRELCEISQKNAGFSDNTVRDLFKDYNLLTLVFELCSPQNRVVTRYAQPQFFLIGGRSRENGAELFDPALNYIATCLGVQRPKKYYFQDITEVQQHVNNLPIEQEGVVLVRENLDGLHHYRLKVKNPGYLTLHALRNGPLTNSRILDLIQNDHLDEYLTQFAEDRPMIDPIQDAYKKLAYDLNRVWHECKDLPTRKDFALAVKSRTSLTSPLFCTLNKEYELPSYGLKKVSNETLLGILQKDYGIK